MIAAFILTPTLLLAQLFLVIALAAGGLVLWYRPDVSGFAAQHRRNRFVEAERDIATDMGIEFRIWMVLRVAMFAVCAGTGLYTGIPLLEAVGVLAGAFGLRWFLGGRAAKRRLRRERTFVDQMRVLRDRIVVSNQSIDTALREMAQKAPSEVTYMFAPLLGPSITDGLIEMGRRGRSPIVEQVVPLLLMSRTRSLEQFVTTIDDVLLRVCEKYLDIQEEAMVTLSQQRGVSIAMMVLMGFMLSVVLHADAFQEYYHSLLGQATLAFVIVFFLGLLWMIGKIVRVKKWSRFNLDEVAGLGKGLG